MKKMYIFKHNPNPNPNHNAPPSPIPVAPGCLQLSYSQPPLWKNSRSASAVIPDSFIIFGFQIEFVYIFWSI